MIDEKKKFIKDYGYSKNKNFFIVDSLPVPHPYMITPKHIEVASNEFMGMLGKEAILRAEEKGVFCDICRAKHNTDYSYKILSYEEHEQVLLVCCKIEIKDNDEIKNIF